MAEQTVISEILHHARVMGKLVIEDLEVLAYRVELAETSDERLAVADQFIETIFKRLAQPRISGGGY